ncbi:hypothetical protein [Haloglycomyces albus]|uniref:hypothetical protein n=1 Tax=Haloglycomyces albus TaxID=526067 RepID=UPI00046D5DFA|nr:hypothetical protein [Haloglycomyces albus]
MTFTVKLDLENAIEQLQQFQGAMSAAGSAYEQFQGALSALSEGSSGAEAPEASGNFTRCQQETESASAVISQTITVIEQYRDTI